MERKKLIYCEIFLLLTLVASSAYWFLNPNSDLEPSIVFLTSLLALFELGRRKSINKEDDSLNEICEKINSPTTSEQISNITVDEIIDEIKQAGPFNKGIIEKQYNGLKVEWTGYLYGVDKRFSGKKGITIHLITDKNLLYARHIWLNTEVELFPEIKVLKQYSKIKVQGIIDHASGAGLAVTLNPTLITTNVGAHA